MNNQLLGNLNPMKETRHETSGLCVDGGVGRCIRGLPATADDAEDDLKALQGTWDLIYFEGDTAKFCRAGSPDAEQPTEFETKPGSGQFVAVYKRSKK